LDCFFRPAMGRWWFPFIGARSHEVPRVVPPWRTTTARDPKNNRGGARNACRSKRGARNACPVKPGRGKQFVPARSLRTGTAWAGEGVLDGEDPPAAFLDEQER
jgi:hypothetical protein